MFESLCRIVVYLPVGKNNSMSDEKYEWKMENLPSVLEG